MEYSYNEKFKGIVAKPNSAEEWFDFIWSIGYDYDGYDDVKGLKGLIDEMVEAAHEGFHCLKDGHIFNDEEADEVSRQRAVAVADTFKRNKVGVCSKCGAKYEEFTDRDHIRCRCGERVNLMEV